MHWLDWAIIGAYVAFVTVIGFVFIRRASGSVAEFFVAGRNLPWWLAGTSLVATSFAADTPLAITKIIAEKGIAGNWLWWNQVVAWALAVVFFARLWRRSGILTDAEFIELRYGGKPGAFLRGFKAVYMSVIVSTYTLAWVMLAMQKIVSATVAKPSWIPELENSIEAALGLAPGSVDAWKWIVLIGLFIVATLYTALSGFWGIVVTDLVQFAIAMVASVLFAYFAVDAVGGIGALKTQLVETLGAGKATSTLNFMPARDSLWMPVSTFIIYLGVLWWGDCGGFAAQRMFATRSEKDSVLTAVWYSVAHFVLRPWPWIVVALVTLVYYPDLADKEAGYPMLMMEILPVGLKGLMIASLLAAFMSTVDTHLNWNASYFVNDIYKRFIAPDSGEKECVRVSRWSTFGFAAMAIIIAYCMDSIADAWKLLFTLQAGIGLVQMLRWFWWRVNAWSEMSAMIGSCLVSLGIELTNRLLTKGFFRAETIDRLLATGLFELKDDIAQIPFTVSIIITVVITGIVWIAVTFLTAPTDDETLEGFFRKVKPGGPLWGKIAQRCSDVPRTGSSLRTVAGWVFAALWLYSAMFAVGKVVMQDYEQSLLAGMLCAVITIILYLLYRKQGNPLTN